MREHEYGVFVWRGDNRYQWRDALKTFARETAAERHADKLNAVTPFTEDFHGYVVRQRQYMQNPMRRPSSDWDWRAGGWGYGMKLGEAQAIWDRAYRKGPEPDPRKQFLAEARRKPKGPITRKDYERAIRAPLPESPVHAQRYRELEERYAERPLDIWRDEEYL